MVEIENEIDKIVENIDVSTISEDMLIDFIQKQQVGSAIAISLLRKKMKKLLQKTSYGTVLKKKVRAIE